MMTDLSYPFFKRHQILQNPCVPIMIRHDLDLKQSILQ